MRVSATPSAEAYRAFDESSNVWKSLNWAETAQRVALWSRALCASNLPAGARVAILLPNGFDAMTIDQACLRCGYVPVPLHAIDNAGSIAYILADSGRPCWWWPMPKPGKNLRYRSGAARTSGRDPRTARPYQRVTQRLSHTRRTSCARVRQDPAAKTAHRLVRLASGWSTVYLCPPRATRQNTASRHCLYLGTTESPRGHAHP